MKTLNKALCAAVALALPGLALGDNPAWSYGQLGYFRADSGDDSTDAYRVKGSLGFAENFHVQAEWIDGEYGITDDFNNQDFDGYRFVLGWNPSVGANTDAVVQLQYFDLEADSVSPGGSDIEVDGFGLGAGLRHMLTEKVELNAMAWWNEAEWDDGSSKEDFSDISLEVGGRYLFNDSISAGVTVVVNDPIADHADSMTIDFRWQFADPF